MDAEQSLHIADIIRTAYENIKQEANNPSAYPAFSPDLTLIGNGSCLASLDVVSLLVNVEGEVNARAGLAVTIVSDNAMSRKKSPFRTMGTLADFVRELIDNADTV